MKIIYTETSDLGVVCALAAFSLQYGDDCHIELTNVEYGMVPVILAPDKHPGAPVQISGRGEAMLEQAFEQCPKIDESVRGQLGVLLNDPVDLGTLLEGKTMLEKVAQVVDLIEL